MRTHPVDKCWNSNATSLLQFVTTCVFLRVLGVYSSLQCKHSWFLIFIFTFPVVVTYSEIFGLTQFFGFFFAPFTGLIMNMKPRNVTNAYFGPMMSFIITLLLCVILGGLVLLPVLEIQVRKWKTIMSMLLWVYIHTGKAWKICLSTVGIEPTTFGILAQCSANWATRQLGSSMWYFGTESSSFDTNVI